MNLTHCICGITSVRLENGFILQEMVLGQVDEEFD